MRLDLRFSDRPIEDLWCQAVVALVFQGPLLTRGRLASLDEKMTGFLTALQKKGFWTAKRGESLLLASQNRIRADKILLKGLGDRAGYNRQVLVDQVREVSAIFDKLDVKDFAIHIPIVEGLEKKYPSQLASSALHLVGPFLANHQKDSDFILKIIFSVERCTNDILSHIATRLREYFASRLDFSIVIKLEAEVQSMSRKGVMQK
jgi:hypothetical protein